MKANELRIGNYVQYGNDTPIELCKKIICVRYDNYVDTGYRKLLHIDDINPIPLTEEWLLKFGLELLYGSCFKVLESELKDEDDFICVQKAIDDWWKVYITSPINKCDIFLCYIKYAHELQNVVYSITGIDLTMAD